MTKEEKLTKALDKAAEFLGYGAPDCPPGKEDNECDKAYCTKCWLDYLMKEVQEMISSDPGWKERARFMPDEKTPAKGWREQAFVVRINGARIVPARLKNIYRDSYGDYAFVKGVRHSATVIDTVNGARYYSLNRNARQA